MARGSITLHQPDGPVSVRPTRGLLRVHVLLPPGAPGEPGADGAAATERPHTDLHALRALLVADVLLRVSELHALPAVLTCDPPPAAALATALSTLAGHPPQPLPADDPDPAAGPVDVLVSPIEATAPTPVPVHLPVAAPFGADGPEVADGTDPLALRLLLLRTHRGEPVEVTTTALETAAATLASWRAAVAAWAEQPSRPMPAEPLAVLRAAWDTDLDVPAVIAELERLAALPMDAEPAPGGRFELFSHVDRVLALDLVRDVGRG